MCRVMLFFIVMEELVSVFLLYLYLHRFVATSMARNVKVLQMGRIVHHDERAIADGGWKNICTSKGNGSCVFLCVFVVFFFL
jgi:hypothetical protein